MNTTATPIRIVKAACPHDCPDTCAMHVHVQDGKAIKVTGDPAHPPTSGVLCTKVSRYAERTYHPDRLLKPLKRVGAKGSGQFVAIEWEQALSEIASRLTAIAHKNPESIVPYSYAGTMGLVQSESMAARFFHKLGASLLDRTICASAGVAGLRYTYGASIGMDMEAFSDARFIVLWGTNSITSNLHLWSRIQQAKRNGAYVVAIDPWRSDTAAKCHEHIALMPGTDGALALGLMYVLITENLLDQDYIDQYTTGFEQLKQRALQYPPDKVAKICGIQAEQIYKLAHGYGQASLDQQGAAIRLNYGMQRARGGANAVRAVLSLPCLTGAWRQASGGVLLSASGWHSINSDALQRPDLLAGRTPRTVNMSTIGDALLDATPPIDALIVYNSNPVAVAPESQKVVRGFAREDLFTVVLEHFMTDTAQYADYVLPATTQLEHLDVHKSYGHLYMLANNPAIEPLGQSLSNTEMFRRLAAHMGFTDTCFTESDQDIARSAYNANHPSSYGYDFDALQVRGWKRLNIAQAPLAKGGFLTPSGRCEFYSQRLFEQGLDPLPDYLPPYESEAMAPQLCEKYPLAMISPPARNFLNSTFVNVQSLRASEGEPYLLIHPEDAAARQINEGQMVRVFNDRGSMLLKSVVTDAARTQVVIAPSVWWKQLTVDGKNANELTSQHLTDLGSAPVFYDCRVQVELA